jgi:hypothetical protein
LNALAAYEAVWMHYYGTDGCPDRCRSKLIGGPAAPLVVSFVRARTGKVAKPAANEIHWQTMIHEAGLAGQIAVRLGTLVEGT